VTDPLAIAESGDQDALIRDWRVRGLFDPFFFVHVILQCRKTVEHLHGVELERFIGLLQQGERKQWIEWPRGHYKTTCFTIGLSIWFVLPHTPEDEKYAVEMLGIDPAAWRSRMELHNQDYSQLLAFENARNSSRKMLEIKWHFEENGIFRACYPEIAYTGDEIPWNTEALKIRRTPSGGRVGESTFQAIGVGGAVQSQHYDIIFEDDCVGENAVKSRVVMQDTKDWHGKLNGAMNGPILGMKTWRFGVSNRWGYDDLNSYVRAEEKDFIFHTRMVIEDDKPIFPEEFSFEQIENLKNSAGMTKRDFACQYYNSPVPPGDQMVPSDLIHRFTVDDDGIKCSCGAKWNASQLRRYMHYDPYNAKGAASTSAPAIAVVGLAPDRHIFLLDYWTVKGSYSQVYGKIIEFNDKWWPDMMTYEDAAGQNMCYFHLTEIQRQPAFRDEKHRFFRRIQAAPTGGRSKDVRIEQSLFPVFEKGKFSCRAAHQTFLQMLETYPHDVPGHDYDLLDALAQGPKFWKFPLAEAEEKQQTVEDESMLKQLGKPYGWAGTAQTTTQWRQ
jgi:hypothetical protein